MRNDRAERDGYKMVPGHIFVPSFAILALPSDSLHEIEAIFYHAGCPVCVAAEQGVAQALDHSRYEIEIVHLGDDKQRVAEAERAGVKSVPALVLDGQPYHINFGADLAALK